MRANYFEATRSAPALAFDAVASVKRLRVVRAIVEAAFHEARLDICRGQTEAALAVVIADAVNEREARAEREWNEVMKDHHVANRDGRDDKDCRADERKAGAQATPALKRDEN